MLHFTCFKKHFICIYNYILYKLLPIIHITIYKQFGYYSYCSTTFLLISELVKIDEWLKLNKLSLNTNKTKFMVLTKQRSARHFDIRIRKTNIAQVNKIFGCNL